MPSLRADARRNRDRLIAVATEVFAQRGIDAPLEEIARQAAVSIGTLYNHFPNRGALLDAVLPDRLAELDRLAEHAVDSEDPWAGFVAFVEGVCAIQARDRSMNEAIMRNSAPSGEASSECGRGWTTLDTVVRHAAESGVLRTDFAADDMAILLQAMANVIAVSDDDRTWRRHLGFVLDGLRPGMATRSTPSR